MYRHALELALKQAIREAVARLRFDGHCDTVLDPDELETHLKHQQSHRLGPLAQQLAGLLERLGLGRLPTETMSLLARLHQLDPSSEAFRYANHLKTTAYHVDVAHLTALFRDAFRIVHGGVLTQLNAYEDFQRDTHHYHTNYWEPLNERPGC